MARRKKQTSVAVRRAPAASEPGPVDPLVARAERVLEHRFNDRALLLRALTHRSFVNEHPGAGAHNEALETLGDAVLSLVTVEALLRASPDADEGALTTRRAAHVSEVALARAADALDLAGLLRIGMSVTSSQGAGSGVPRSLRADLVEALLGAVYLDAGLEAARACATRLLGPPPAEAPSAATSNPKTELQERLQRITGDAPRYEATHEGGPRHAPTFVARALLRDHVLGEGRGPSKQLATEAAAAAALAALPADEAGVRARFGARVPPT